MIRDDRPVSLAERRTRERDEAVHLLRAAEAECVELRERVAELEAELLGARRAGFDEHERTRAQLRAAEAQVARERTAFEDILGSISLYIQWRYVTKRLTTPQKERFADAVEAWSARLHADEPDPHGSSTDRWWREDDDPAEPLALRVDRLMAQVDGLSEQVNVKPCRWVLGEFRVGTVSARIPYPTSGLVGGLVDVPLLAVDAADRDEPGLAAGQADVLG